LRGGSSQTGGKGRGEVGRRGLSRRGFLRLAGASLAGYPFLSREALFGGAAPDAEAHRGLPYGVAVGDVTHDGAVVWLKSTGATNLSVQYGTDPALESFETAGFGGVSAEADFTAKIFLEGLEPKTVYYYRGAAAGEEPGSICRFVTAPRPFDRASVRFAFSGDSREWYQPFSILDSVRLVKPDFFLHLGDTIYADRDWVAKEIDQFWAKYKTNREDQPTRRLLSETSIYVTWDDHEVENDYYGAHPLAKIGQKAFFDYWPIRQDARDPYRLYRSFRWGMAAELFILDTRQYRDPAAETMLGKEQKRWLLDGLSRSTAWFKFVATSVPITAPGRDRWGGYGKERSEILDFIADNKITGVVFIAADVHYAAVSRVPGGPGLKEIIVGPIGAPKNRWTRGTASRFEFFSNSTYSYGLVVIDEASDPPLAEVRLYDENNRLLYETKVGVPAG
jgi:alkaline phosphatase D